MRTPLAALALALAVLLAGCVSIPNSGSVKTGDGVANDDDLQLNYQVTGPQDGATQADIVDNFVRAALVPTNNYETARLFLARNVSETWDPSASVSIRRGDGVISGEATSWQYSMTVAAEIDVNGVYSEDVEPRERTLDFGLVEEDGQWRISALDDGIVILQINFLNVFSAQPLFFFDPSYRYLVPDVRWFPKTGSITTRIANALLAGPAPWLASGVLVTAFPPGTRLASDIPVVSGRVAVQLSDEARDGTSEQDRNRMSQQFTASLITVNTVRTVALTVGTAALAPEAATVDAVVQPAVNSGVLALREDRFGFITGDQVTAIDALSEKVVGLGALGASYSPRTGSIAARSADGVYLARATIDAPFLIDPRSNLVDPSIDDVGFTWSAQSDGLSSLRAFGLDGVAHEVNIASLQGDPRVVSIEVSRDGTRLLLYLVGDTGPRLVVAGIVRGPGNVPISLNVEPAELRVAEGTPVDATWESDRAVAAIGGQGDATTVTEYGIGGPSTNIGIAGNAVQIVGGNGGTTGLRVLDSDGTVLRATGNASWRDAGLTASFVATQQPG